MGWSAWTRSKQQTRRHDPLLERWGKHGIAFGLGLATGVGWCLVTMSHSLYCGWPW